MTRNEAKDKAKRMFSVKGDAILASVLVNSIYDEFEKEIDNQCSSIDEDFTITTKELCAILESFKKSMVQ